METRASISCEIWNRPEIMCYLLLLPKPEDFLNILFEIQIQSKH